MDLEANHSIDTLVAKIHNSSLHINQRLKACDELGAHATRLSHGVDALIAALDDPDDEIVSRAAKNLGKLGRGAAHALDPLAVKLFEFEIGDTFRALGDAIWKILEKPADLICHIERGIKQANASVVCELVEGIERQKYQIGAEFAAILADVVADEASARPTKNSALRKITAMSPPPFEIAPGLLRCFHVDFPAVEVSVADLSSVPDYWSSSMTLEEYDELNRVERSRGSQDDNSIPRILDLSGPVSLSIWMPALRHIALAAIAADPKLSEADLLERRASMRFDEFERWQRSLGVYSISNPPIDSDIIEKFEMALTEDVELSPIEIIELGAQPDDFYEQRGLTRLKHHDGMMRLLHDALPLGSQPISKLQQDDDRGRTTSLGLQIAKFIEPPPPEVVELCVDYLTHWRECPAMLSQQAARVLLRYDEELRPFASQLKEALRSFDPGALEDFEEYWGTKNRELILRVLKRI